MPGSDHGGQPDQQGRRQVQDAPADQTYTEYDSVISYEASLASEDSAAVDSAEGSADQSSSGEYSELKSSSTLQMGAPGSAPVAGAGAPTAGELRAEQASQLMQLGYELEETLQRSPVTSGLNPEGSDPAVAQSGPSSVPVISREPAARMEVQPCTQQQPVAQVQQQPVQQQLAQPPAMPDVTSQQLVDISTALQQLTATFAVMPQLMASIANDTVSAALAQFQQPPVIQQPVSGGQGGDVQQQSVCQRGSEPQPPPLSASSPQVTDSQPTAVGSEGGDEQKRSLDQLLVPSSPSASPTQPTDVQESLGNDGNRGGMPRRASWGRAPPTMVTR